MSIFLFCAYLAAQLVTAISVFLASGGLDVLHSGVDDSETPTRQPPQGDKNTESDNINIDFGSGKSIELGICMIMLHLILLLPKAIFQPKTIEAFSCLIILLTGTKQTETKNSTDLKIKVNYPLFLKKGKSNMFERAMKEDFDNQKMITKKGPLGKKSKMKEKDIRTNKGVLGAKGASNNKESSSREKFQLSGGFFSSRGTGQRFNPKSDIESPDKIRAEIGEYFNKTQQSGVTKYHSASNF